MNVASESNDFTQQSSIDVAVGASAATNARTVEETIISIFLSPSCRCLSRVHSRLFMALGKRRLRCRIWWRIKHHPTRAESTGGTDVSSGRPSFSLAGMGDTLSVIPLRDGLCLAAP